ncbi:hypothetical protein NCU07912 [Neurospora crassa OR74A]|uniref:Uncharacterized protein n=1 Tax=Neurospora crassa (strain ATCC 24698 / 74-OR23-1A / CBS 708.71 / DSM 1257 / FGSC 987) TaxID=367110 RepID=Q7SA05_NEUCR|nr:hypothetical protein NCU07912 [Neurospora crassa OR74A]EAA33192.3 hypothetical protein NCU07912 [Neurospora crassa OR74A]|eukprot:XP_962428.3 hypothetical protein NCU07912 [Neurospora crassa OR74A]
MFCPSEVWCPCAICSFSASGRTLIIGEGLQWREVVDVSRYGMPADIKQVPIIDSLDSTNGWSFFNEKEKCEYDRIRFVCTVGLLSGFRSWAELRLVSERASWSAAGLVF